MTGKIRLICAALLVFFIVLMAGCTGNTQTAGSAGDSSGITGAGTTDNTTMPLMPEGNATFRPGQYGNGTMVPPDGTGNRTPPEGFGNGTMLDMPGGNQSMAWPAGTNQTPPGGFGNRTFPADNGEARPFNGSSNATTTL